MLFSFRGNTMFRGNNISSINTSHIVRCFTSRHAMPTSCRITRLIRKREIALLADWLLQLQLKTNIYFAVQWKIQHQGTTPFTVQHLSRYIAFHGTTPFVVRHISRYGTFRGPAPFAVEHLSWWALLLLLLVELVNFQKRVKLFRAML